MRFPAQEHHRSVAALGTFNLRKHACLAGLDHLETGVLEAEGVLVDHALDGAVAVVARLDAVDLAVQLLLELGNVGEVFQALVIQRLRYGQGVLGVFKVGPHGFHRTGITVLLDVVFHGRHPVAEKHVHVLAVGQRLVGHRYRDHGGFGLVAQRLQHHAGDRSGDGDVGPADVGEIDGVTLFGLCGLCQNRQTQ
ncbi:hypothetical protein D3C77_177310 [compost metagenome]